MTSDKLLALENIRQQYKQDCIVTFKNHVFQCDTPTLFMLIKAETAVDKDGYPVPLSLEDCHQLQYTLNDAFSTAKRSYFQRLAELGLDKLTEVTQESEEAPE